MEDWSDPFFANQWADQTSQSPMAPIVLETEQKTDPLWTQPTEQLWTQSTEQFPKIDPVIKATATPVTSDPLLNVQDNLENLQIYSSETSLSKIDPRKLVQISQIEQELLSTSGIRFLIKVYDPVKVGDVVNSYISYKVTTQTNSALLRNSLTTVHRRFSDFYWLFHRLCSKYPGLVVPPAPEKQSIGRFQEEFIELRRIALERFIRKIAAHPILQNDPDFGAFLESETFHDDMNQKKREESKGHISLLSGSACSVDKDFDDETKKEFEDQPKEFDESLIQDKKLELDNLELQLKALYKAIDLVVKQRKELSGVTMDFSSSLRELAQVELSDILTRKLSHLSDIQIALKDIYDKQSKDDFVHLATCVEEWIRIVQSIRNALSFRSKSFDHLLSLEGSYAKKKEQLDKLRQSKSSKNEKILNTVKELEQNERELLESRKEYEDLSIMLVNEFDRLDKEKIVDFCHSVKDFLVGYIEHQRQIVVLWQSYS